MKIRKRHLEKWQSMESYLDDDIRDSLHAIVDALASRYKNAPKGTKKQAAVGIMLGALVALEEEGIVEITFDK